MDEDNLVVSNKNALKNASKLLNVTEDEMTNSLTQRVIAAHGDIVRKSHSTQQAEYGRDALAKAIYDRLFTWIIQRINQTIVVPGSDASKRFNKVIGVLDIYGFEIFDTNSFEQFCINYCNEKLQQLFIGRFCNATLQSRDYIQLINLLLLCRVGAETRARGVSSGGHRMDERRLLQQSNYLRFGGAIAQGHHFNHGRSMSNRWQNHR